WIHGRTQPDREIGAIPPTTGGAASAGTVAEASAPFALYRIGDAVASRNVHAAVLEGLRVGMGL
ncbi:MAG: hypothetical protein L0G69_11670, partial [Brevibacterium sp.]|nr:hypothetical protein [Brevibacterium sp.]